MRKFLLIAGILAALCFSCELPLENLPGPNPKDYNVNDPDVVRSFWAQNIATRNYYKVSAVKLATGRHCQVWVEFHSGVNEETAKKVADEYDNNIYKKMIDAFSFKDYYDDHDDYTYSDAMEFADVLTDEDGKLCILLFDIKDGYKKGVNDAYVAGYFWANDFFDRNYSNQCDMIYIDTYPGVPGSEESNITLAHEMQHLMNFATAMLMRSDDGYPKQMDVWIDEGLSAAAEWVYANKHSGDKWRWYNLNGDGRSIQSSIDKGNNFFVWDNHKDENQYAILDDYATVYLFFQWLRLQAGKLDIYKDIIISPDPDLWAVVYAIDEYSSNDYSDWETLLRDWLAANYINASSGIYGYKNDPVLNNITPKTVPAGTKSLNLYPGEGVYSVVNNTFTTMPSSDAGSYIRYAGLNKNFPQVSSSNVYTGGRLLTYNINSDFDGGSEQGTTTGIANIAAASDGRFVTEPLSGPFRIGARDVLSRNERGNADFVRHSRRTVVNE